MTGAYCLVQGRVWRFYQRNKACLSPSISLIKLITEVENHTQTRLDPLSTVVKLTTVGGGLTKVRKTTVYSLRGVMEICRYSTPPGGFMAFETDMELVHSSGYICLRSHVLIHFQGDFKLKPPLEFKRWCHGNPLL